MSLRLCAYCQCFFNFARKNTKYCDKCVKIVERTRTIKNQQEASNEVQTKKLSHDLVEYTRSSTPNIRDTGFDFSLFKLELDNR